MQDIVLFMQHHLILSIAFFIILVLLMIIEFLKQKTDSTQISPAQLTHLINRENAAIIDVRPTSLFADGHIIGSVSIPMADFESKAKKFEKFKARPVVIVCMLGTDSSRAATLLAKKGQQARILKGGIDAWKKADMPLVKE